MHPQKIRCAAAQIDSPAPAAQRYDGAISMKFFEFLATAFVRVFGITEPSPSQLRTATWFIVGLLAAVLVLLTVAGLVLDHVLYR